jgi:hypothetical protein
MKLTGLHLLLTYKCLYECDHCFAWGSPRQSGTMSLRQIEDILEQAADTGTIESIYFEGGEPFLYHAILQRCVQTAAAMGFKVGIVSNGYWAVTEDDAREWLRPMAGMLHDLSISTDRYHTDAEISEEAENARAAAETLGIPVDFISVAQPEETDAARVTGQLPHGLCGVMYRGRAASELVDRTGRQPWEGFTECPHEDLRDPGRVHVDPLGNMHICQGISIGNLFERPLAEICADFDPEAHPVLGPLLEGGPAELVRRYDLDHQDGYADACHLCDAARRSLRARFPDTLTPDQAYGDFD